LLLEKNVRIARDALPLTNIYLELAAASFVKEVTLRVEDHVVNLICRSSAECLEVAVFAGAVRPYQAGAESLVMYIVVSWFSGKYDCKLFEKVPATLF